MKPEKKSVIKKKLIGTRIYQKHLEKYYEEHINEILPDDLHRGDITSSNRMLAYSDAVMATCATFLVLPIRNLNKKKDEQRLSEFINSVAIEFVIFFLGFLIVLTIWENMNIRAIVIKRVDDFVLALVLFEMLATTVLPFSLSLQGHYPFSKVSILITCTALGILQIIDIVIVLYATHLPNLLHIDLKKWSKSDLRELAMIMIFKPLLSLIILAISGAFCLIHYGISWAFIALLILMPTIRKLYWLLRRRFICQRIKKYEETEKDLFLMHFSKGNISKERIESMTDAAIAIVACILILDITVEEFPKTVEVDKHGLNFELKNMMPEFLTFFATFILVSTLWYINHAVLCLIKSVNSIILYLQKIFLSLCCLSPLAGNMVLHFATKHNNDSIIAIRFSAFIVFFSSVANFFILLYGFLNKAKYFYDWASVEHLRKNKRQHVYAYAKALIIPFWSFICILGSFGSFTTANYVLYVSFITMFCSFLATKIIFMSHIGTATKYLKSKTQRRTSLVENKRAECASTKEDQTNSAVFVNARRKSDSNRPESNL